MTTAATRIDSLTGDYVLDTEHTRIGFVAKHTVGPKVRGRFDAYEGSAHLDGDDPSKSTAQLTIQASSIQTGNRRRDPFLRGKFLTADDHPIITFTSTRVEQVDHTRVKVIGDLTVRGVTKPVTVDFELTGTDNDSSGNVRARFKGSATINRKDWGVRWAAAAGMVSKKVTLELDGAAIRQF
jgi:polyisoprenoid-binding protein YceI